MTEATRKPNYAVRAPAQRPVYEVYDVASGDAVACFPYDANRESKRALAFGKAQAERDDLRDGRSKVDVFARALRLADLDAAVLAIRDALGIVDLDCSTVAFAGESDRSRYAALPNSYQRAEFLRCWLSAEFDAAAERVGQNG